MKTYKMQIIWAGEKEWKPYGRLPWDDLGEAIISAETSLENDRMYHGNIDKIRILDGKGNAVWPRSEVNKN